MWTARRLLNFHWKSMKIPRHDDRSRARDEGERHRLSGLAAYMSLNEPNLILRDGTPVLIRRLVAEDAHLYPDFLGEVAADDLRLRFFAPIREVSHEVLDQFINYDP